MTLLLALSCPICTDYYVLPHSLQCGHTFCFTCLDSWLEINCECPICREKVKHNARVLALEEIIDIVIRDTTGLFAETLTNTANQEVENSEYKEYLQRKQNALNVYDKNKISGIVEDEVERCGRCLFELVDGVCPSCHRVYYRGGIVGGDDDRFIEDEAEDDENYGSENYDNTDEHEYGYGLSEGELYPEDSEADDDSFIDDTPFSFNSWGHGSDRYDSEEDGSDAKSFRSRRSGESNINSREPGPDDTPCPVRENSPRNSECSEPESSLRRRLRRGVKGSENETDQSASSTSSSTKDKSEGNNAEFSNYDSDNSDISPCDKRKRKLRLRRGVVADSDSDSESCHSPPSHSSSKVNSEFMRLYNKAKQNMANNPKNLEGSSDFEVPAAETKESEDDEGNSNIKTLPRKKLMVQSDSESGQEAVSQNEISDADPDENEDKSLTASDDEKNSSTSETFLINHEKEKSPVKESFSELEEENDVVDDEHYYSAEHSSQLSISDPEDHTDDESSLYSSNGSDNENIEVEDNEEGDDNLLDSDSDAENSFSKRGKRKFKDSSDLKSGSNNYKKLKRRF